MNKERLVLVLLLLKKLPLLLMSSAMFCFVKQASTHMHEISQSDGYKERTIKKEVNMSSERRMLKFPFVIRQSCSLDERVALLDPSLLQQYVPIKYARKNECPLVTSETDSHH